jgi:hypothetical protein
MKPYGLDRRSTCNRKVRGTQRDCPCCIPIKQYSSKGIKAAARRAGKRACQEFA